MQSSEYALTFKTFLVWDLLGILTWLLAIIETKIVLLFRFMHSVRRWMT